MNWYNFIRLIRTIYGSELPDLELIQRLGLLAIKIGQVHALRIDFLNEEKCRHLAKLYQGVTSIPAEQVDKLIIEYAGKDYFSNFSDFNKEPFASASIGQVHRARLISGEEVAVKIVKKDFTASFEKDVRSVQKFFKVATWFYPKLRGVANPASLLKEIEKTTLAELDLSNEQAGQEILQKIFNEMKDKYDLSRLAFPKIYKNLSSKNILVTEFLDKPTINELLNRKKFTYDNLLEFFHIHGFYMFVAGIFHGDIHPGNIIFDGKHFYFLDTGYIGSVSDKIRINLLKFFEFLSDYDYPQCAFYLHAMSKKQLSEEKYKIFLKKFIDLYADFKDKTVSEISLTKKMMQTIKLGVLSGMEFEEGIFDIIKSLMYMDGMVLACNPDAILLKDMKRFVEEFQKV
jgi:ubiquinone biosynthesis protein